MAGCVPIILSCLANKSVTVWLGKLHNKNNDENKTNKKRRREKVRGWGGRVGWGVGVAVMINVKGKLWLFSV